MMRKWKDVHNLQSNEPKPTLASRIGGWGALIIIAVVVGAGVGFAAPFWLDHRQYKYEHRHDRIDRNRSMVSSFYDRSEEHQAQIIANARTTAATGAILGGLAAAGWPIYYRARYGRRRSA